MAKLTGEIGSTGLNVSAGMVDEEVLPELRSDNSRKVFKQMADNDPVVGGILFAIDMLIRGVEWSVEENPDADDPEGDAQFVTECMHDMSHSWSDFISEVLTMLPHGFSFFEIVYKKRDGEKSETSRMPSSKYSDGRVGWRKFAIRAQETLVRWELDEDGGLKGFTQRAAPDYKEVTIPMIKGLLFRTNVIKNNPEGRSILRSAYRPWYFKKRMEEIEGIGIERDLAGLPMAEVDAEIMTGTDPDSQAFMNSIRTILKNVRQDKEAGIIWPLVYDPETGNQMATFKLLNSGGTRTFDITNIIERYDARIAMTVLADFILLGHQQVGSFALSSDKTSLFARAIGAWLGMIEDVLNRFAVHRLFRVNGMDTSNLPRIVHKDIEEPDLQVLGAFLSQMGSMGMPIFPDEALEKYLREVAHLPPQSEEAADLQDAKQSAELRQLLGQTSQGMSGEDMGLPPDEEVMNDEGEDDDEGAPISGGEDDDADWQG